MVLVGKVDEKRSQLQQFANHRLVIRDTPLKLLAATTTTLTTTTPVTVVDCVVVAIVVTTVHTIGWWFAIHLSNY